LSRGAVVGRFTGMLSLNSSKSCGKKKKFDERKMSKKENLVKKISKTGAKKMLLKKIIT
jgi:hypothetical protein